MIIKAIICFDTSSPQPSPPSKAMEEGMKQAPLSTCVYEAE